MLGRHHAASACVLSTKTAVFSFEEDAEERAAAATVHRHAAVVAAAAPAVLLLLCCCCCAALLHLCFVPRVQNHRGVASCACTLLFFLKTSAVTTLLKRNERSTIM